MRVVRAEAELAGALTTAASEALKAFGDASVYLEKYVERPRHVEIQVLADDFARRSPGRARVLDPAPAPEAGRGGSLGRGGHRASRADGRGRRGGGPCGGLSRAPAPASSCWRPTAAFYFLEMNTRIQVEHPVTEMVYGAGPGAGAAADRGRAADAASAGAAGAAGDGPSNAGSPARTPPTDFFPPPVASSTCGRPRGPGVRWDAGIEAGNEVTLHYDSLLGKLIAWGRDRGDAIARMRRALGELVIVGVATNQSFHLRLLADPAFLEAGDRQPVPRPAAAIWRVAAAGSADVVGLAVAAALAEEEARGRTEAGGHRRTARPTAVPGSGPRAGRRSKAGRGAVRPDTAATGPAALVTDAVRIHAIAAGGDGVGRLADGRAVFVPRTAPGDLVQLAALEVKARYARARVGRILEPGPDRVAPRMHPL